jgi:hypothetical protein
MLQLLSVGVWVCVHMGMCVWKFTGVSAFMAMFTCMQVRGDNPLTHY